MTEKQQDFLNEARDVLRAGLETSSWVSVDDTGARHKARNGFCTLIGNAWFTWFATCTSKSRLNFLDLLRAGHTDYVLNEAAFGFLSPNRVMSVKVSAPAGTASSAKISTSSSGYTTLPG